MDEMWIESNEWPGYSISSLGNVRNDIRGTEVRQSRTRAGAMKVGLSFEGKQYTRSVKVLVADMFVGGKTNIKDTAIHLDGDQTNCAADNLVWRPRWFACKYTYQMSVIDQEDRFGPLVEVNSGVRYKSMVEAGLRNGLLFEHIEHSIEYHTAVYPTNQIFNLA